MKSRLDLETHTCEDRLELNYFFSQARANTNIFLDQSFQKLIISRLNFDHFLVLRMRFKINSCHVGERCFPDSDFTWAGRPGILTDS